MFLSRSVLTQVYYTGQTFSIQGPLNIRGPDKVIAGTRNMERDAQDAPVVVATLVHDPDGDGGRLLSVHTRSPFGALELRHPLATQQVLSSAGRAPTQQVISSIGGEENVRISVDAVDFQDNETARAQIVSSQGTVCKSATCNAPITVCSINTSTVTVLVRSSPGVHPAHVHEKTNTFYFSLSQVYASPRARTRRFRSSSSDRFGMLLPPTSMRSTMAPRAKVMFARFAYTRCVCIVVSACVPARACFRTRIQYPPGHAAHIPAWRHACIFL